MKNKKKNRKKDKDNDYNDNRNVNGRRMTKHHIIPRSRGGGERKTVKLPERYHVAWHTFFGNLTPKESILYMRIIFSRNGKKHGRWTSEELYALQLSIQRKSEKRRR